MPYKRNPANAITFRRFVPSPLADWQQSLLSSAGFRVLAAFFADSDLSLAERFADASSSVMC